MHLKYRQTCRACGSSSLKKVIDLGPQYLQGSFIKPGKEMPPMRQIPCTLVRCNPEADENACGLLQMEHSVPPTILYAAYWYRSGTNNTMRNHLKSIVDEVMTLIEGEDLKVLDIGCNDGTLLNYYSDSFEKFGVDPSDVAQEIKPPVKVVQDIFPSSSLNKILKGKKLDIITSIAMFYDLEDPVAFTRSIKEHLSSNGIWVFEMSYMPEMLKKNSYDTLCHEHLEYYSLTALEFIMRKGGMKIFNISFNEINGGSIRCFATHDENFSFDRVETKEKLNAQRQFEFDLELDTDKPYIEFQQRIDKEKEKLLNLLKDLKNNGKRIHIYGASTKGNTILQFCGIDKNLIDVASERNPDKFGARTLGTDIPIVSEEESRSMHPDYYLVLPWHFKEEFLERENNMLQQGVGFIFPLPEIDIYKA
jgi:SAM-dependent methyltransferase